MKFGEALVGAGALSQEQLAKALDMQKILGGRLGTNILELGYLSEAALLDHLGRFRSTHTVGAAELRKIPTAVLRSVPRKLALRYRIIPYQVRGKTLYVASKNPGTPLQEDEISFLTSFMVRTSLALELHLDVALRKHFKAPLDQRLVALTRRLGGIGGGPAPSSAPPAEAGTSASTSPASATSASATSASGTSALGTSASGTSPSAPSPFTPPVPVPPTSPSPLAPASPAAVPGQSPEMEFVELDAADLALLGQSTSDQESASPSAEPAVPLVGRGIFAQPADEPVSAEPSPGEEKISDSDVPDPAVPDPAVPDPAVPDPDVPDPDEDLDDLDGDLDGAEDEDSLEPPPADGDIEERLIWAARQLQAADIRDEIGDVLLGFSAAFFRRRALVIRRKEQLVGWMAAGEGEDAPDEEVFGELTFETTAPSVFFGLQEPDSFWLGPLPMLPANRQLTEHLGGDPSRPPKACLVLPISLRSKIVGYLYGDNGQAGVAGAPVAEMKRLVAKAGLAFEVYLLKNKIRTM